jgi:hypothetical protein
LKEAAGEKGGRGGATKLEPYAFRNQSRIRPSAIVAGGRTARSLEPLLGPQFIFGAVGTRMFSTIPEALNHLEQVLGQEAG